MNKKNRATAFLLLFLSFIIILCAWVGIIVQSQHNCIGDNCLICYWVNSCVNIIKYLGFSAVVTAIAITVIYIHIALSQKNKNKSLNTTLVNLKVKLSD